MKALVDGTLPQITLKLIGLVAIGYMAWAVAVDAQRTGSIGPVETLLPTLLFILASWRLVCLRRWAALVVVAFGWLLAVTASVFTIAPGGDWGGINWEYFPGAMLFAVAGTVSILLSWRRLRAGW